VLPEFDPQSLSRAIKRLLAERDGIQPDDHGWFPIDQVAERVSVVLQTRIVRAHIEHVGDRARLEIRESRIRIQRRRTRSSRSQIPDILFHATTVDAIDDIREAGRLSGGRRRLTLSDDEVQSWRAAHRMSGHPRVLVVDTLRARRSGVRFFRNRHNGLYSATDIPIRHVLSLRDNYDVQLSAGGIPILRGEDGVLRMALIRVTRRSGTTWEVAKGKIEPGETPELAAVREVQEEMGVSVDFRITRYVGPVRYGFLAPGGAPRLKTIWLYLMVPQGELGDFNPSVREGIGDVKWFTVNEAVAAVTHSSLRPMMRRARELVTRYGES
jgi:RNA:NAD 2'-phosphotransferase (TPT1/KptA family)